jgi:ubiquitin-activating enzyme E1
MDFFEIFNRVPQNIMKWIKDPTVFNKGMSVENSQGKEDVNTYLIGMKINIIDDCIKQAVNMFYTNYKHSIMQLLKAYPKDHITDNGTLFWSNGKRVPTAYDKYDASNEHHLDYVEATAHLLARVFNLDDNFTRVYVEKVSSMYNYEDTFTINSDIKIASNDEELKKEKEKVASSEIVLPETSTEYQHLNLVPQEFEKDDPTNWHVSFITSASNLRAQNYGIPTASYNETKGIAGRIIPAIATTTSVVSGLIVLEMFKYMYGNKLESYRSTFVNLADTTLVYSEPIQAKTIEIAGVKFNDWTRFEYYENSSFGKFKEYFEKVFKTTISMIVYDNKLLFADFMDDSDGYLNMNIDAVIKSKNPDADFSNSILFSLASSDDDVNLPEIHFIMNGKDNQVASI